MSISRDDVAHIARLARLALSPAETDSLTHDLGEILGYVEKIGALDTSTDEVRGAADAALNSGAESSDPIVQRIVPHPTPMRPDDIQPSLAVDAALGQSADHDDEFFRVPPVIDREEA